MKVASLLLIVNLAYAAGTITPVSPVPTIRVGVVTYEDGAHVPESTGESSILALTRQTFSAGAANYFRRTLQPISFRIAPGTYQDVFQWYESGKIDVAVVTPGVAALILSRMPAGSQSNIVATESLKGEPYYHSVFIAHTGSGKWSPERLKQVIREDNASGKVTVRVAFVNPLSTSGYLAPVKVMVGDPPDPRHIIWTGNHSATLKRVQAARGNSEPEVIGFVQESTAYNATTGQAERDIEPDRYFGGLDKIELPQGVVLVNHHLFQKSLNSFKFIKDVLITDIFKIPPKKLDGTEGLRFEAIQDEDKVAEDFRTVERVLGVGARWKDVSQFVPRIGVGEMVQEIHNYQTSTAHPVRIAVVLSGGGAKCAYQVGVLKGLDRALYKAQMHPDLVVGASGGAINAAIFARKEFDRAQVDGAQVDQLWDKFGNLWEKSTTDKILKIPVATQWKLGLTLALAQAFVLMGLVKIVFSLLSRRLPMTAGYVPWVEALLIAAALIAETLTVAALPRRAMMSIDPFAIIAGGWFRSMFVAVSLICAALSGLVAWKPGRFRVFDFRAAIVITCFFVAGGWAAYAIRHQQALFVSEGFMNTISEEYQAMFKKSNESRVTDSEYRADLIIAASVLRSNGTQENEKKPGDSLYAWVSHESDAPCALQDQACPDLTPINERVTPDEFFKLIAGSSTIWPVYEPVTVDVPRQPPLGLIDGGFGHNSPVEAAVMWGATHIIVVDAGAEEGPAEGDLAANASGAFSFLFDEAQRVDVVARGNSRVFEIRPACQKCSGNLDNYFQNQVGPMAGPQTIGLFEFEPQAIRNAIARGEGDVSEFASRFQRILGDPVFDDEGGVVNPPEAGRRKPAN